RDGLERGAAFAGGEGPVGAVGAGGARVSRAGLGDAGAFERLAGGQVGDRPAHQSAFDRGAFGGVADEDVVDLPPPGPVGVVGVVELQPGLGGLGPLGQVD